MAPKEKDPNEIFEKFKKRNPPEFFGSEDATGVEEFITRIEKIFDVFQSTKKEKMLVNAYMFREVAEMDYRDD